MYATGNHGLDAVATTIACIGAVEAAGRPTAWAAALTGTTLVSSTGHTVASRDDLWTTGWYRRDPPPSPALIADGVRCERPRRWVVLCPGLVDPTLARGQRCGRV